ncbi:hypothetical protein ACFSCW_04975 [Sphingomonas tabacisoli]|uniref:Uncharacterized protein n=1 Tax=Sphingomonas tabacisoli TaxID=2249466 RepID=A0ABW4I0R6_9SPHN
MAYGNFCIGLVLGWAALFAGGTSLAARLILFGWIAILILLASIAPQPGFAARGIVMGLCAHLFFQWRLRESRA